MPYVAAAVTVVAGVVGAMGAIQSGQAAQQASRYNAEVQRNNAIAEEYNRQYQNQLASEQTQIIQNNLSVQQAQAAERIRLIDEESRMQEASQRRQADEARLAGDRKQATMINNAGANGVAMSGSVLDVWSDLGTQSDALALEYDESALRTRHSAELSIWATNAGLVDATNQTNESIWAIGNDNAAMNWNSRTSQSKSRSGANLSIFEGNNARTSSYYSAAGSILGGAGQAYSNFPTIG